MYTSAVAVVLGMFLGWNTSPPACVANAPSTHSLSGRFLYDGVPPQAALLEIPRARHLRDGTPVPSDDLIHYAGLGLRDESLLVNGADRGVANVVVWLSDRRVPIPDLPPVRRLPQPVELIFKNGRLQPHVLAWWAPTRSLSLKNEDKYNINLRWSPLEANPFNVLVSHTRSALVDCLPERRPSVVSCDVFSWMQPAILFPCAHPYFAVSGPDGRFRIDRLPVGEWEFTAWHERCGYVKSEAWPRGRATVKIETATTDLGTIKLSPDIFVPRKAQGAGQGTPVPTRAE